MSGSARRVLRQHELTAARELPAAVVDYYAAGAGDETTAGEASAAWGRYRLRPRVLTDVSAVHVATDLLGVRLATPVAVAPTALHGLASPDGECATVTGAGAAGALTVVSTRASRRLEDVGRTATSPWWFQAYAMRDPDLTDALARRAADAGATAVVLTADTPYVGRKERVAGTRLEVPDADFLVNLGQHLPDRAAARAAAEQDPAATVATIGRLAAASGLPVLVKGVLRGDEALRCVAAGAAGVVVSNHGGRQLDRAVPTALALPEVVAAVGDRVPVLVDGGLRSGLDVLTALALGARAVLVGRPVLWALASGGAAAVAEVLTALTEDLRHVMALAGVPSLADLDPRLVTPAD
ncbi:alpha-hydroxy acid oxidase [Modestobacter sp. SSW1-42]|uniref:alpha-hydroxy acid oxidase n=1 Tax=Modestobacter sp. SSW1-42 TaxID=596372 RepID=UPI003985EB28